MAAQIDVCNLALIELGQSELLTALDDQSKISRHFRAQWNTALDEILALRVWGFARKRAVIAASPVAPEFGTGFRYKLPGDFLRFVMDRDNHDQDYRQEGGFLVSEDGAPLDIIYVARVDIAQFTPLAARLMALKLAYHCAYAITGDTNQTDRMYRLYQRALGDASMADATQQAAEPWDSDVWIRSRDQGR